MDPKGSAEPWEQEVSQNVGKPRRWLIFERAAKEAAFPLRECIFLSEDPETDSKHIISGIVLNRA
jgi:hypothetical protein